MVIFYVFQKIRSGVGSIALEKWGGGRAKQVGIDRRLVRVKEWGPHY